MQIFLIFLGLFFLIAFLQRNEKTPAEKEMDTFAVKCREIERTHEAKKQAALAKTRFNANSTVYHKR